MSTQAGDSYDALPYPSYPFALTHPDRLHVLGRLSGLETAPVERCRVLELGCAAGGNLLPIALELPGARCVGIDASRTQVEEGRADVAALGATNCELSHGDILELGPGLGRFDYITCHGVYSWVPRPVQDAILSLCRALLAPGGVAYVSYNTYPGWRMRSMIRDMMRYHARQFDEPRVAVAQARRLLDYLAKNVSAERGAYTVLLNQELTMLRKQSDAYLFHEHLEATNEPLYFHQFVERARAAGLRYLGEASIGETRPTLFPQLAEDEGRGTPATLEAEQYRDFLINRSFRTTLLCHDEAALRPRARPEDVTALFVGGKAERREPAPPEPGKPATEGPQDPEYRTVLGKGARVHLPMVARALEALEARWPRLVPFGELADLVGATGDERALLAEHVLELFVDDHVELRPRQLPLAATPGERPEALPLARRQAERQQVVTNGRHEPHELDRFERELVRALDGRRDLAGVHAALVEAARSERLEVTKDGVPLRDPAELREIFESAAPARLANLARRSLLRGPA